MKTAVKLSIDEEVLRQAEALDIDLAEALELALKERLLKEERKRQWLEENREAIKAYSEHIERDGLWSDRIRHL